MNLRPMPRTGLLLLTCLALAIACQSLTGSSGDGPGASASSAPAARGATGSLSGVVEDYHDRPLAGAVVTAFDDERHMNVSVFTDGNGGFQFPPLQARTWRVRAKILGYEIRDQQVELSEAGAEAEFKLRLTEDLNAQLPASYFYARLQWPTPEIHGNFARSCANCHQIGDPLWRRPRTRQQWEAVVQRMRFRGPPLMDETRELLIPTLVKAFDESSHSPFEAPPAPSGDATRAVIWEYEVDPEGRNGCHDLEIGLDGWVYTEDGYAVHPETLERRKYPINRRSHSIEMAPDGNMWMTVTGVDTLEKLDVSTGEVTTYEHPLIGDDKGQYPHTLRFDDRGRIWYTLTVSNHVAVFDPATETFTYHDLPGPMNWTGPVPIPIAYGLDVAPDQTIWWSQLLAHTIGSVDPETGEIRAYESPVDGPRRLRVGPDNVVWVPGYGSSELGRFDPKTEKWKVYELPTEPLGTELPYALSVNRRTNEVWIAGSNSDTLIRFRPESEEFTIFPLASQANFTREIEFDDENNVWTCAPDRGLGPEGPLSGRFIKLQLLERIGSCGDRTIQLGEECDDGNARAGDGCSPSCVYESDRAFAFDD